MNKVKISFIITLAFMLINSMVFAQAPNEINYQGVALNTSGTPIASTNISIRSTIHTGTANGTVVYSEERTVATDATGLFDFRIGSSGTTSVTGSIASINWQVGNKYLEIEMDPAGGTNYVVMGTQRLVSVPYAINAKEAGSLTPSAVVNLNNLATSGVTTNQVMQFNGTNWAPANVVTTPFSLPYTGTDNSATSFKVTNTLSAGTAIHGKATNTNPNSNGILGEGSGGSSVGVRATNTNGFAVYATGTPTATLSPVIYGVSNSTTTGVGVMGESNGTTGRGVYGETISGTGVEGYSNNAGSIGVKGNSLAGIGVKAYSFSGTALDVEGNLKIAGGNTNPSAGAVLTSDASGNAVWQKPILFKGNYHSGTGYNLPNNTWVTVTLGEVYDLGGNNFFPTGSATNPNSFVAPISGYYEFNGHAETSLNSSVYNIERFEYFLSINNATTIFGTPSNAIHNNANFSNSTLVFNEIIHLNAGDVVKLQVKQASGNSLTSKMYHTTFTGKLLYKD